MPNQEVELRRGIALYDAAQQPGPTRPRAGYDPAPYVACHRPAFFFKDARWTSCTITL